MHRFFIGILCCVSCALAADPPPSATGPLLGCPVDRGPEIIELPPQDPADPRLEVLTGRAEIDLAAGAVFSEPLRLRRGDAVLSAPAARYNGATGEFTMEGGLEYQDPTGATAPRAPSPAPAASGPFWSWRPCSPTRPRRPWSRSRPSSRASWARNPSPRTSTPTPRTASSWGCPARETMGAVLGSLEEMVEYGLQDDYYQKYPGLVQKLTIADLTKAAVKTVRPEGVVWIIVGDRAQIEPDGTLADNLRLLVRRSRQVGVAPFDSQIVTVAAQDALALRANCVTCHEGADAGASSHLLTATTTSMGTPPRVNFNLEVCEGCHLDQYNTFEMTIPGRTFYGGRDGGLQGIGAKRGAEFLCPLKRGKAAPDEQLIPSGAVLLEEQNRLPRWANSRAQTGSLNLHQRDKAVDLRFVRNKLCQDTAKPERILS